MAPAPPVRDRVVLQIGADLEGRRPTPRRSLGAGRQSRSTSVEAPEPAPRCMRSSTAPLGARRDAQRGACDAPRKAASWYAANTQYANILYHPLRVPGAAKTPGIQRITA